MTKTNSKLKLSKLILQTNELPSFELTKTLTFWEFYKMTEKLRKLKDDYYNMHTEQQALAEGFLYRNKVHMLYADPGIGKSTICQQIALELASGKPVFKSLKVPKSFNIFYLQLEGDREESIERMRLMCGHGTENHEEPNFTNLYWDCEHMGLNILKAENTVRLAQDILEIMPEPDLVIIDPIYQAVVGDISKADVATQYCQFSSFLRVSLNCALLHVHHTPKQTFDSFGQKVEKETFYGSQWFAAHMNSMHYLKASDKNQGKVTLYNKKQRNSNMLAEIMLTFDVESHTVFIEQDVNKMTGYEHVLNYLRDCKKNNFQASIYDILEETKLSHTYLRNIVIGMVKNNLLKVHMSSRGKKLYEIQG